MSNPGSLKSSANYQNGRQNKFIVCSELMNYRKDILMGEPHSSEYAANSSKSYKYNYWPFRHLMMFEKRINVESTQFLYHKAY